MLGSKYKVGGQILLIPQEVIEPNPNQPRKRFPMEELEELAQSIRQNGILQPVSVRKRSDGKYELVAGERRLRAARLVGVAKMPCIVVDVPVEKSAMYALIENIQRQDLDFFEEAEAIYQLMRDYNLSQEETAKRLGKAPCTLSNKLRLLRLTQMERDTIIRAGLTERHARALLSLENPTLRGRALDIIAQRHLTVSEAETLIHQMAQNGTAPKREVIRLFKDVRLFVNTLNHAVDTMRKAGIEANSAKTETEEYIEYIVRIPKKGCYTVKTKQPQQQVS